jgi:soluble lytic murein transglycosylase
MRRANELLAGGMNHLAAAELRAVERERGGDQSTLLYLLATYQAANDIPAARRLARRLGSQSGLSPEQRRRLDFPLAYWDTVSAEAGANGVDPLLVLAMMRQESQFDADALSPG